ncbi:MAG: hypothetical protein ACREOU_07665 [Candidatus Eiseniibacteriota bacterium]
MPLRAPLKRRSSKRHPSFAAVAMACAFALGSLGSFAGSGVPQAHAQAAVDVQRALDVTQGVIDRASMTIRCGADEARLECVYLAQATALQRSAVSSYSGGFLRDALATTLRARDRAYMALRVAQDASRGEFVLFSIERTDALIDRVAPVVRASGQEQGLRLLDVAVDLQSRAKALAKAGRPRAALSATTQSRERALRALRISDGATNAHPERARALLERTQDLLAESAWLAAGGPAASLYEKALATQARAWERFNSLDPARAVDLSLKARDQLSDALARADRRVDRATVENALLRNAEALAELRASVAGDARAEQQIAGAEARLARAREHLEAGRLAQAMSELRAVEEIRARVRP